MESHNLERDGRDIVDPVLRHSGYGLHGRDLGHYLRNNGRFCGINAHVTQPVDAFHPEPVVAFTKLPDVGRAVLHRQPRHAVQADHVALDS